MAAKGKKNQTIRASILRNVRMFVVLMLVYLLQVCVMPYFRIAGITPSLVMIAIAVTTVGFGKLRAFWAGAFFGIVLEAMQPTTQLLNLMLYPVSALLCCALFANKSTHQIDYERSLGKVGRDLSPYLRMPLCTLVLITIYEVVNIVYIYLRGSDLTMAHIGRGLLDVVMTTVLCIVLMVPMRALMGVPKEQVDEFEPQPYVGKPAAEK